MRCNNLVTAADVGGDWKDANYTPETTVPATVSVAIPPPRAATNETTRARDPSTTVRPVIVLVSVPERKRDVDEDPRPKFATKDVFFRHVQSDEGSVDVPKIDYVKTVRKGNLSLILRSFRGEFFEKKKKKQN